ncbi:MAG: hypothetical protein KDK99_11520 [Verrucomicrobiales bacterium]|nr:hypothetical protein [Verrucomicrobiales bacterium]
MKQVIGILGLTFGVIAIGVAIFQDNLREITSPPPEERSLKELAVSAGKKFLADKLLEDRSPPAPPEKASGLFSGISNRYDAVAMVYAVMGFAAMILGLISWIRRDHVRISGGAVALGLMAVAWQYVLVGVGIAVVIFLLANLSA